MLSKRKIIKDKTKGFSLVELSIAIIIIGLLITGIVQGTSMINQSKLYTVINEYRAFYNGINSFKARYNYMPGDLPNASAYFPNCDTTPIKCDGNGNGIIEWYTSTNFTDQNESFRAWQQLAAAGTIPGSYTGIAAVSNQADTTNVPTSKAFSDAGYSFIAYAPYDNNPGETIIFGKFSPGSFSGTALISPGDAFAIDSKIDDGHPRRGIVWSTGSPNPASCFNGPSLDQYTYNLTLTSAGLCSLHLLYNLS